MTDPLNELKRLVEAANDPNIHMEIGLYASRLEVAFLAWEKDRELLRQASAYVKNDLDEITERIGQHSCGPDNGCDMDCVSRHHVGTLYMQIQSTLTKGQQ